MQHGGTCRHPRTVPSLFDSRLSLEGKMRLRAVLLSAAVAIPAGGYAFGGWAVVTVENPPERLVVGVPYTLEFSVRQHGMTLLDGLRGQVEAKGANGSSTVDAGPAGRKGSTSPRSPFQ